MPSFLRHQICIGYDVEPIEFRVSEGEFSDDGTTATFTTKAGDVFRVYEYASGFAFRDERVRVFPRPVHGADLTERADIG